MKKERNIIVITLIITIILMYSLVHSIFSVREYKSLVIGLYIGPGTWRDGIRALELLFDNYKIEYRELNPSNIKDNALSEINILIIPGGWAWDYHVALGIRGRNIIKEFVANGGSVIGICAGAFYLSKSIIWEGKRYTYSLNLINATAIGPKEEYPWPTSGTIDIVLKKELANYLGKNIISALYYGGPEFVEIGNGVSILAYYADDMKPAIIMGRYGKGIVILVGVHLEMREDTWPLLLTLIEIAKKELEPRSALQLMLSSLFHTFLHMPYTGVDYVSI